MSLYPVFPPSTTIRDYGYESTHRLHRGDFPQPLLYDGVQVLGTNDLDEEDMLYPSRDLDQDHHETLDHSGGSYDPDEINRRATALFEFAPENDNEVALTEGQEIWISYRHGQGWLVAEDPITGEKGLVPEKYVDIWDDDEPRQVMLMVDDEWVDTDEEVGFGDLEIDDRKENKNKE